MGNECSIVRRGGGGASLNYKVVGGTSQPSSASENTIWVNTDAEITSHVFSTTQPENPVEGMVWLTIGTSSSTPINILKKDNTVMVYPTACQQYVSGAWVAKTARVYQGGSWVDWGFFIYSSGDALEDVTGGWTAVGKGLDWESRNNTLAPTITFGETSMSIVHNETGWGAGGIAYTNNLIDFAGYSKLRVEGVFDVTRDGTLRVWSAIGDYQATNSVASLGLKDVTDNVVELDISALNSRYHVGFSFYTDENTHANLTINKMYLAK